eukprot:6015951-Amphidinium_carterae.3
MEKVRTKDISNTHTTHNSQEKTNHNSHLIKNNTTLNLKRHNIHRYNKGYGKQWNKGGKKGQQVPVHQINDNDNTYFYDEDNLSWDNSWSQEWFPEGDYAPQSSGREADQQSQVLQQQPSGPQTMGSLYEIASLTAVFIHIDRQSPRHLKDFWSVVIDTVAAVSVCPMTYCEHIAAKTMPESAPRRQLQVKD